MKYRLEDRKIKRWLMRTLRFNDDELLVLRHALKIAIETGSFGSGDEQYQKVVQQLRKKLEIAIKILM